MVNLGTVRPGSTVYIPFDTFAGSTGASITMSGLLASDIEVYKDGSMTQRGSDNGYTLLDTDGIDLDGITGIHGVSISLADNSTAGFWAAGSRYWVVVSSITVDTQTVNFIAATFDIGYPDAVLNTTIATLSTQTSFTLTAGPAEDDALNGCVVIIHDVASAVQLGWALISDYTGSTKTVTLVAGTTFTAAATDNIAVYTPRLLPTVAGRTLDISSGGEAGLDWANVGTPSSTVSLTNTTVATVTTTGTATAVTTVNGLAANVITAAATAADFTTEIQAGLATAAALATAQTSIDDLPTNAELATALAAADDAVLAAIADVQTDTNDIQARIPAALTAGGSIKAALQNEAHGGVAAVLTLERVVVTSATSNQPAVKFTGNGTGAGLQTTGGASGNGLQADGGSTTGHGISAAAPTSGDGIRASGAGSGKAGIYGYSVSGSGIGIHGQGFGASGVGVRASSALYGSYGMEISSISTTGLRITGASAGHGIDAVGGATGHGINANGGTTNGTAGINATSQATNANGMTLTGKGTGHGLTVTGGATGHGILATGGATSGDGIRAVAATSGDGIEAVGAGGGYDINADIQGSLSGSVGSLVTLDEDSTTIDMDGVIATAVAAIVIETGYDLQQTLQLIGAAAAAKLSGGATSTNVFRSLDDSADRITATVDSDGNRTAVTHNV